MSLYDPPTVRGDMDTKQLANLVAELIDDMAFIVNGNLDSRNVRVNSIVADRMDVNQLSAISANLGHIVAGSIESVTITGSLIQTRFAGIYPRIELSSAGNLLSAEVIPGRRIRVTPSGISGYPELVFEDGITTGSMVMSQGEFHIGTSNANTYIGGNKLDIEAPNGIQFYTSGLVMFSNFSKIYSIADGKTLQQALDGL